jgi:hypothetical protein
MTKLIKENGVSYNYLKDDISVIICNHMSYTWKEFDIHKKNYTFEELDRALWMAVDTKIAWEMDRDSPT